MAYFNYPNISIIRTPLGPEVFGLVRVYCNMIYKGMANKLRQFYFLFKIL